MADTLASLVVKLVGDTVGFKSDMADAEKSAGGFSGAMHNLAGKMGSLGGVMQNALGWVTGNVIMKGIDAIVGSFGALKEGMIDGNAQFERYAVQFGVLLGSTDAAKARLDDLAKFGASTPFELPQVVEADKILQGFGLHSEEAAKKFGYSGEQIRTIAGDVAAGTGAQFNEMSLLIGKFSSGATGEAISRMQEMGITTREELAKMGLEFSKSGELLSPLPESMNVVLGIMKDKYGGMMDAQSRTFEGMVSNLNDWVAGTLRTIGQPIFEVLKDKLGNVLTFLGSPQVQGAITGFATFLSDGIGKAISFVMDILGAMEEGFGENGILGAINNFVFRLSTQLGVSVKDANRLSTTFTTAFSTVRDAIATVVSWVQTNWPTIQATIVTVLQAVVGFVQTNWPMIQTVIGSVLANAKMLFETVLVPVLQFALEQFGRIVAWVQENWPLIQAAISAVLGRINTVINRDIPPIVKVFQDAFALIKPIVEGALNLVLGVIKSVLLIMTGDTQGALNNLQATFETVFGGIIDFVKSLPDKFISFGRQVIQGFIDGMEQMGEALKQKIYALIPEPVRKILGIASPSKLMQGYGVMSAQGYINGWTGTFKRQSDWFNVDPIAAGAPAATGPVTPAWSGADARDRQSGWSPGAGVPGAQPPSQTRIILQVGERELGDWLWDWTDTQRRRWGGEYSG